MGPNPNSCRSPSPWHQSGRGVVLRPEASFYEKWRICDSPVKDRSLSESLTWFRSVSVRKSCFESTRLVRVFCCVLTIRFCVCCTLPRSHVLSFFDEFVPHSLHILGFFRSVEGSLREATRYEMLGVMPFSQHAKFRSPTLCSGSLPSIPFMAIGYIHVYALYMSELFLIVHVLQLRERNQNTRWVRI